jgi:hypothetical protein
LEVGILEVGILEVDILEVDILTLHLRGIAQWSTFASKLCRIIFATTSGSSATGADDAGGRQDDDDDGGDEDDADAGQVAPRLVVGQELEPSAGVDLI